jgi:hypothetical protein
MILGSKRRAMKRPSPCSSATARVRVEPDRLADRAAPAVRRRRAGDRSREHLQHLFPLVVARSRRRCGALEGCRAHCRHVGPGSIGALLVGVAGARSELRPRHPIIPINHLEGHIFSPYLQKRGRASRAAGAFLSLVISAGTPRSTTCAAAGRELLTATRDDAIGETFDKVAKFIGLPYPGGPQIEKLRAAGSRDRSAFPLPVAQFKDESLDFSYSGIKAARFRSRASIRFARTAISSSLRDFLRDVPGCALFAQLFDRLDSRLVAIGDPGSRPERAMAGGWRRTGCCGSASARGASASITVPPAGEALLHRTTPP